MQRLRIIVFSKLLPKPDESSGSRRFFALLEMLTQNHAVDLWIEINEAHTPWSLPAEELHRYRRLLESIGVSLLPYGWKQLVATLSKTRYDLGLFEFYFMATRHARLFRCFNPSAKVVVDSVDVHFARFAAGAALGVVAPHLVEKTRRRELAAYRAADAVIVVSERDGDVLAAENGMPPRFLLPNVFPLRPRARQARANEVVFVGHFDHAPNRDGIRWFIQEIWPQIRTAIPHARLTIIGSKAPPEILALSQTPGVHVIGHVPDMNPYLDRAAVSIAPLRYGAGMKGKVNEAMASGLPVVTTSVGAQGINVISGEHLLIADTSTDFAQAVVSLLNNPNQCERIGLAGQKYIIALYSPERVKPMLDCMLEAVVSQRQPNTPPWSGWKRALSLIFQLPWALRLCFLSPYMTLYQRFNKYFGAR